MHHVPVWMQRRAASVAKKLSSGSLVANPDVQASSELVSSSGFEGRRAVACLPFSFLFWTQGLLDYWRLLRGPRFGATIEGCRQL